LLTIARARKDAATPVDVAAALQERLDNAAERLGKLTGENAAWGKVVAAMLRSGPALEAEIGKMGRHVPAVPPGMPIGGETDWFGD
jgi:hypothetical protein